MIIYIIFLDNMIMIMIMAFRCSLSAPADGDPAPASARATSLPAPKAQSACAPAAGWAGPLRRSCCVLLTGGFDGLLPALDDHLVFVCGTQCVSLEHLHIAQVGQLGQLGHVDVVAGRATEGLDQFGFLHFTRQQDV